MTHDTKEFIIPEVENIAGFISEKEVVFCSQLKSYYKFAFGQDACFSVCNRPFPDFYRVTYECTSLFRVCGLPGVKIKFLGPLTAIIGNWEIQSFKIYDSMHKEWLGNSLSEAVIDYTCSNKSRARELIAEKFPNSTILFSLIDGIPLQYETIVELSKQLKLKEQEAVIA